MKANARCAKIHLWFMLSTVVSGSWTVCDTVEIHIIINEYTDAMLRVPRSRTQLAVLLHSCIAVSVSHLPSALSVDGIQWVMCTCP